MLALCPVETRSNEGPSNVLDVDEIEADRPEPLVSEWREDGLVSVCGDEASPDQVAVDRNTELSGEVVVATPRVAEFGSGLGPSGRPGLWQLYRIDHLDELGHFSGGDPEVPVTPRRFHGDETDVDQTLEVLAGC